MFFSSEQEHHTSSAVQVSGGLSAEQDEHLVINERRKINWTTLFSEKHTYLNSLPSSKRNQYTPWWVKYKLRQPLKTHANHTGILAVLYGEKHKGPPLSATFPDTT